MAASLGAEFETIPMRRGVRRVELHCDGLRHPRSTVLGGDCFTPYAEITHLAIGPLGLRIATRRGLYLLRRRGFAEHGGPERLATALVARIQQRPGGAEQIARFLALEERARRPGRAVVTRAVILLCGVAFIAQVLLGPMAELSGMFSAPLVSAGEFWRLLTANFLHGSLPHLLLNLLGLFVFGTLAERSLGRAGVAFVMAASGAGSMLGCWWADYAWALGASGIVYGLAGAILWLEFRRPAEVPAGWRLPRRVFVAAIVGETALLSLVPGVAHAAHLGGLAAGALATALVAPPAPRLRRGWLVPLDAAVAVALALSLASATRALFSQDAHALERRAEALLDMDGLSPLVSNNEAWRIAVSEDPTPRALDLALRLAERAAEETDRLDPNVLDTLAEVLFVAGQAEQAVHVIDEAIALAPDQPYFQEQRRRFRGERAADDRPEAPESATEGPPPLRILPAPELRV